MKNIIHNLQIMKTAKTIAKYVHISVGFLAIPFGIWLYTENETGLCWLAILLGIGIVWNDIKKWNSA